MFTGRSAPLTTLRMAARNLLRRRMRTGLTALGVAIGVSAIVAFSTLAQGMWRAIDGLVRINNGDLMVFQAGVAADIFSVLDEEQTCAVLREVPGVAETIGVLWCVLPVEAEPFVILFGMQLADLPRVGEELVRGRQPENDREVMLGTIARKVFEKDVGDTLDIRGITHEIVGIFRTDVVFLNGAVLVSLPHLQELTGNAGRVTTVQVYLEPGVDAEAAAERIERDVPGVVAVSGAETYNKVDRGLEVMNGGVYAISFIALIVGGIVVANTMWMSVLERAREIGVLRAVGWGRRRIVTLILIEAGGVGLLACGLGCVMGIGLAQLATRIRTAEQYLEPQFGWQPFLLALVVAEVLSLLGALVPAARAARISPAEALRYE